MTGAIVVSWGNSVRGREGKSLEVFGKALQYFEELTKEGRVHGHREYVALTGNTAAFGGMQVIDGDVEQLQKLMLEDRCQRLLIEASEITDNFTITLCAGGSDAAIQEQVTRYADTLSGLGIL